MDDREKVIKGLECCNMPNNHNDCPYNGAAHYNICTHQLLTDAIALLKEQEALEPVEMIDDFYPIGDPLRTVGWKCGKCMERVAGYDNYCPNCGRELKWDD